MEDDISVRLADQVHTRPLLTCSLNREATSSEEYLPITIPNGPNKVGLNGVSLGSGPSDISAGFIIFKQANFIQLKILKINFHGNAAQQLECQLL